MAKARLGKASRIWQDFIARLAGADITTVAEKLGLQVLRSRRDPRALCPFHDDHDPSLNFYVDRDRTTALFRVFIDHIGKIAVGWGAASKRW